jgi:hypothetical protein
MEAIHIQTKLDSDTLYLPQLRPLIGRTVEIIVQERAADAETRPNGQISRRATWKAALAGLSNLDIDWDAYKRQREYEIRSASDRTS